MLFNSGFYEIKALQQAHYSSPNCCAHVCTTILHFGISPMLNVLSSGKLNSGKQCDVTTTLMVRVQLFCGVVNSVFTTIKCFVVCQVVGYVSVKVEFFGPSQCVVLFVEFNGCFTSLPTFWTPIAIDSLLALVYEVGIVC